MGNLPETRLNRAAGPSFITVRQAVDLLAEAHGAATSAAAAQLIAMFNDAVHEGRPALYERDGPALKAVADPAERYVAVIQSLDALRRGPPADDRNDPLANTMRDLRRRRMVRAGIPEASWYDTEFTLYPRKIAVLDLVEVRAAEFEGFALLAPEVSSASLAPPEPVESQGAGVVTHLTKRRNNPLAAVFTRAKAEATDATNPHSVWAALVALPHGPNPPPELGEYRTTNNRIKATGARGGWLSKEAFMDRWRRGTV